MSVTVVIPTRNRRAFLPDLVRALQEQTHRDFHAVVIDDGGTDDSEVVLAEAIGADERFHVHRTRNRGPAAARNTGCDDASTEWLAFTDDDCLPQAGWLAALLEAAKEQPADVVQGRTVADPSVSRRVLPWYSRSQEIGTWSGRFQTCNLLVRTSLFRDVGGFDESFPAHGFGEDTDLGLRLTRRGARTAFAADALVHHRLISMTYPEFLRRRYRWSQAVHLVAVNADARAIFPHPYVAYRADVAFWAATPVALWALLSRRWIVVAAGVAAYGAVQGSKSRYKQRDRLTSAAWGATELPGLAATSIGFLIQSVRHRTLLL